MPNINKSAAVPFVNQKGERSMKRVKVERYVAGKRPAYAKEEEEEYYTTDDDEDEEIDEEMSDDRDSEDNTSDNRLRKPTLKVERELDDETGSSRNIEGIPRSSTPPMKVDKEKQLEDDEEDDDDDPRYRRLKQLASKPETKNLLQVQTTSKVFAKVEDKPRVIEEEDEEEIKERHAQARARTLEELIGTKTTLADFPDQQAIGRESPDSEEEISRRYETEDLLDKIVITRIKPEEEIRKTESLIEEQSKIFIEQAKQESILSAQVHQKIEEDNERELEIETRKKGEHGAIDMDSVRTDDEDEEIAYEEWKLREIKRVLRDRSERALEARARG